jgi:hypothetical protein
MEQKALHNRKMALLCSTHQSRSPFVVSSVNPRVVFQQERYDVRVPKVGGLQQKTVSKQTTLLG